MKSFPRFMLPFLAAALLAAFAGCQSNPKTADAKAAEDEYVYVMVTGSNIPKKIKKSDIVAGKVDPEVQMQLMTKEEFAKSTQPRAMKGN